MGGFAEFCKDEAMGAFLLLLLGPDRQAVSIPIQDLQPVAPAIPEHEEMTGKRILADDRSGQGGQTVKTPAHVGRRAGEENANGGGTERERLTHPERLILTHLVL